MHFTPREADVYGLATRGYTSRYIAAQLFLSPRTVETHIRHIYEKTGAKCRDDLIERRENTTNGGAMLLDVSGLMPLWRCLHCPRIIPAVGGVRLSTVDEHEVTHG